MGFPAAEGVPVGLIGSLDDFSLQDLLQILSLGRKTGHLVLETRDGGASVLFREGRIVAAVDDAAPPPAMSRASLPEARRDSVLRARIAATLDRFARCRQGEFAFRACAEAPREVRGRPIAPGTLHSGLEVVDLLLEIAWREDEEGRDTPAPCGERAPVPGAASEPSLLLVDDEDLVRRLLARYLAEGGYRVVEAGDVESAVQRGTSLAEAGVRFVLVADLHMPASAGDSFRGGFEVARRLARLRLRPPVVIMAEGPSAALREVPKRGVWSVVRKPGLSKLDPEEFEADLRALAGRIVREVLPQVCGLPA
jgi:CheY-like chemotaxis protein